MRWHYVKRGIQDYWCWLIFALMVGFCAYWFVTILCSCGEAEEIKRVDSSADIGKKKDSGLSIDVDYSKYRGFCGDGRCAYGETMSNCWTDCRPRAWHDGEKEIDPNWLPPIEFPPGPLPPGEK